MAVEVLGSNNTSNIINIAPPLPRGSGIVTGKPAVAAAADNKRKPAAPLPVAGGSNNPFARTAKQVKKN